MDDLRTILEQLEAPWYEYVWERSRTNTDSAAYRAAGVSRSSFYNLDAEERNRLNTIADALHRDRILAAEIELRNAALEAAIVKVAGLKERDRKLRQAVASEILDRIVGKPTQRQEVTGPDGDPLQFVIVGANPENL